MIFQLQDNVGNLKSLRQHSRFDENVRESENFSLKNERDALTVRMYKMKIQQVANKVRLEKVYGDLRDILKHISMINFDNSRKKLLIKITSHVSLDGQRFESQRGKSVFF